MLTVNLLDAMPDSVWHEVYDLSEFGSDGLHPGGLPPLMDVAGTPTPCCSPQSNLTSDLWQERTPRPFFTSCIAAPS